MGPAQRVPADGRLHDLEGSSGRPFVFLGPERRTEDSKVNTEMIAVRVDPNVSATARTIAERNGLSLSQLLRRALAAEIARLAEKAEQDDAQSWTRTSTRSGARSATLRARWREV